MKTGSIVMSVLPFCASEPHTPINERLHGLARNSVGSRCSKLMIVSGEREERKADQVHDKTGRNFLVGARTPNHDH